MKLDRIVKELSRTVESLGMQVRYEEGAFQSGTCKVLGRDVIVLNRRHPVEAHFGMLVRILRDLPVDAVYLKPAVRNALETAWNNGY